MTLGPEDFSLQLSCRMTTAKSSASISFYFTDALPIYTSNQNYLKSNRIVSLLIMAKKVEENLVYIVLYTTAYVVLKKHY